METETMLTTFDNPFDPFDDFTSWWLFDIEKGYNTCSRLARIARYSEEFSMKEENDDRERAIDEIVDNDILNIYKKVTRSTANDSVDTIDGEDEPNETENVDVENEAEASET